MNRITKLAISLVLAVLITMTGYFFLQNNDTEIFLAFCLVGVVSYTGLLAIYCVRVSAFWFFLAAMVSMILLIVPIPALLGCCLGVFLFGCHYVFWLRESADG